MLKLSYATKARFHRFARGLRYAFGTWTADDALQMEYESNCLTGSWPLECVDAEGVAELARDLFGEHPGMQRWSMEAVARVAQKWSSTGDMTSAAQDWALDLLTEYAATDGVTLTRIDE